jgi:hypothetical protein
MISNNSKIAFMILKNSPLRRAVPFELVGGIFHDGHRFARGKVRRPVAPDWVEIGEIQQLKSRRNVLFIQLAAQARTE